MQMPSYMIQRAHLDRLIHSVQQAGYRCIGPQVREGTIVYDTLTQAKQLPWGINAQQTPGKYHIEQTDDPRAFAWANGPQALKPILFKPIETVWRVTRDAQGKLLFQPEAVTEEPIAFFGARACDLAAMGVQDQVFIHQQAVDPRYQARRQNLLVIAVNCGVSSSNCFCVSAGTGPEVSSQYDMVMTEIANGFVIQAGSSTGEQLLTLLNLNYATDTEILLAKEEPLKAAAMQTKRIPFDNTSALRDLLFSQLNHPRWDEVAERCLSCGNCTSVCPTCFCQSTVEKPALDGQSSVHQHEWDSCFTAGHSYVAGHSVRDHTRERYRQWLTHKVGSWFDQFGSSGCVGCGRCVTWCPVGIDITEELAAISGESHVALDRVERENE